MSHLINQTLAKMDWLMLARSENFMWEPAACKWPADRSPDRSAFITQAVQQRWPTGHDRSAYEFCLTSRGVRPVGRPVGLDNTLSSKGVRPVMTGRPVFIQPSSKGVRPVGRPVGVDNTLSSKGVRPVMTGRPRQLPVLSAGGPTGRATGRP